MPYSDPADQRAYNREWMNRRRDDFFWDKVCAHCGAEFPLVLDHIDRTTKVSHRIWSWREERRLVELAKCQVLCAPCQNRRNAKERSKPMVHGTSHGYLTKGCRCDECRAYRSRKSKEEVARNRLRRASPAPLGSESAGKE